MSTSFSSQQRTNDNNLGAATASSQFQPRSFGSAVDIQDDLQRKEETEDSSSGDRPKQFSGRSNFLDPLALARQQADRFSQTPLLVGLSSVQARLTVGAVGDKYEQEADAVAAQVVQRINSPQVQQPRASVQRKAEEEELQMKPIVSKLQKVGAKGGEVPGTIEQQIQSARGKGNPLAPQLQTQMGNAMGADFSGVRVHTDSQSNELNQSIQAKAFTTGQDVFFRSGTYDPGSHSGQELIAHELTHVVQQSGGANQKKSVEKSDASKDAVQRVKYNHELQKFYSEVLSGQQIDETNAVVTATSNMALGGGHTAIYIERLTGDKPTLRPDNKKIDLVYYSGGSGSAPEGSQESMASSSSASDSSSGSSSSSGGSSATDEKGVVIRIEDGMTARESNKRSWVIAASQVETLITKAREVQSNQEKYSYTLLGVSPFKKKVMNCARFGEVILKAAGISASAGSVFKIPSTLTKGDDIGYQKDQDFADAEQSEQQEGGQREQQEQQATPYGQLQPGKKIATFEEGKEVQGSRDETGALTTKFTFRATPLYETDITAQPFGIFVLPNLIETGRVKIVDRNPRGDYYVRIQDVFDTSGNIITS